MNEFTEVKEALKDFKKGKMVIITDDEDRENEGDLACAAEKITPAKVNFMAKYGRGLICVAMEKSILDRLHIPMMTADNQSSFGTGFTISVDARHNISTGISAKDRAHTIKILADKNSNPRDLVAPGHIFPLRAISGGVLKRAGQTEASVDMARLSKLYPAAVICEIMNEDGTMSRLKDLKKFAQKHNVKILSIRNLIKYRFSKEKLIKKIAKTQLPTKFGTFTLHAYEEITSGASHFALVSRKIDPKKATLTRVHSECLTGDILCSLKCDCGEQLEYALKEINKTGGVLVYLRQEGRGIGFGNKMKAYELQEKGMDTVEANIKLGFPPDKRDYGIGAQILSDLNIKKINLLTNNPRKIYGLDGYNIKIIKRIPIKIKANNENKKYLSTKKAKLGHLL